MILDRYVAIDDACAWPNLTLMPGGEIIAIIFNQPCHGLWEGDVECWASRDGGRLWEQRGTVAAHEPGTVRMNHAVGLAHDGSLVAIVSGWTSKPPRPAPGQEPPDRFSPAHRLTSSGDARFSEWPSVRPRPKVLDNVVCRSDDGGRTWNRASTFSLPSGIPPPEGL